MAAPTCVLTLVQKFAYRAEAAEEFSNTYAFTGPTPADNTAWRALFDALVLQHKTLIFGGVRILGGYGYNKIPEKGDHAIYAVDLTVPDTTVQGTFGVTGSVTRLSGDTAMWIRWGLDRLNEKGKRVYLRKYIHPAMCVAGSPDMVAPEWTTLATAFGTKMMNGSFLDGRKITDRLGTAVLTSGSSPYTTTRTLKRRPKRTPS